jgi:hypothetical protein
MILNLNNMTTHITTLGAINKITIEYCCPKLASKQFKYKCPECDRDLILKQGLN